MRVKFKAEQRSGLEEPEEGLLKTLVDLSKGESVERRPYQMWIALRNEWQRLADARAASKTSVGGTTSRTAKIEKQMRVLDAILRGDAL